MFIKPYLKLIRHRRINILIIIHEFALNLVKQPAISIETKEYSLIFAATKLYSVELNRKIQIMQFEKAARCLKMGRCKRYYRKYNN